MAKDLFDSMPEPVKKLRAQAAGELREKARKQWWAENSKVVGQPKKLERPLK